MAITSTRSIVTSLSGDVNAGLSFPAASNPNSPGVLLSYNLVAGNNTINLPTGAGVIFGATIIPPSGNVQTITLKGVNGDTGISIGLIDPTSLGFGLVTPVSIVLSAGGVITNLRILWT